MMRKLLMLVLLAAGIAAVFALLILGSAVVLVRQHSPLYGATL